MEYFVPFNITFRKKIKNWPHKLKGKVIEYPVLAMDFSVNTYTDKPKEEPIPEYPIHEEDEDDEIEPTIPEVKQEVVCFLLIANPISGKMKWFDITKVRFLNLQQPNNPTLP